MTINGEANGNKTADLVGIRAAARALKVSPSTISRYLKSYPELDRGGEAQPKVNVAVLRRHRLSNLHPAPRGRRAARLIADGEALPPAAGPVGDAPPATTMAPPANYAHAKAVRETVLAQRARIDLDEKRGLLVPISEIQDALFDAGALLQRDLLELAGQLAERIAVMDDPKEIAALVEAEHRRVLAALAASLREQAIAELEPKALAASLRAPS